MRLLLLTLVAVLLAATPTALKTVLAPEPDVAATMDRWNARVADYYVRAERGEYDEEAFLREAAPIAAELRGYRKAGWLTAEHWQRGPRLFHSPNRYYEGPTRACRDLHSDWGTFLEEIEGRTIFQRAYAPPPKNEPAPSQPPVPQP
jgi:hypothetical protein